MQSNDGRKDAFFLLDGVAAIPCVFRGVDGSIGNKKEDGERRGKASCDLY